MRCASVGAGVRNARADFLSGEAADLAQRERDLRIGRQRRVTAREDQAEAVVLDALFIRPRAGVDDGDVDLVAPLVQRIEPRAAAHAVDRLEASGGHEPRARIRRHAFARPLLESGPERVVQRFLGDVEVAEQADQRREDAAGIGEIDGVHRLMNGLIGRRHNDGSNHNQWLMANG
jgi:hypothetical protein